MAEPQLNERTLGLLSAAHLRQLVMQLAHENQGLKLQLIDLVIAVSVSCARATDEKLVITEADFLAAAKKNLKFEIVPNFLNPDKPIKVYSLVEIEEKKDGEPSGEPGQLAAGDGDAPGSSRPLAN